MPRLSVIISTYNSTEDLDSCLESIEQHSSGLDYELIVVDNNSPDRSCLELQKKYPAVSFHFLNSNDGFGAANNYGLRCASGDYILFLNPDTILLENTFKLGIDYLNSHPSVGALSFMVVHPNGDPQYCYNRFPGIREELLVALYLDVYFHRQLVKRDYEEKLRHGTSFPVDWISGAFILTRRSVLDAVGSFDESFFIFYEDIDLCFRIKSAGFEIQYVPLSRIIHKGGQSTSGYAHTLVYNRYRSKYVFARKHYSFARRSIIVSLSVLGLLFRLGATFVFSYGSSSEKRARRSAYLDCLRMSLIMPSTTTKTIMSD